MNIHLSLQIAVVFASVAYASTLFADGNSIGKVEHPYVQPQEREVALTSFYQTSESLNSKDLLKQKLSIGRAFNDRWFGEVAVSGKKKVNQGFAVSSYEIEAKWQLTEQGEYSADYGVLFEYENKHSDDTGEVSVVLLTERQWGKWIGTANIAGIYEWGETLNNEFEAAVAGQLRYRYKPTLEPAIELYSGEINNGIGPVLTGMKRLAPGKKLKWEVGVIFGVQDRDADQTYRALLEYEF